MGNSQVSGILSRPLVMSPQLPLLPYTPYEPAFRCPERSKDPEWQVEKLLYQYHYAQTNSDRTKTYDLFLNITNLSNGARVTCTVTVDQLAAASSKGATPWVKCKEEVEETPGDLVLSTEVSLNAEDGVLGVRQMWYCADTILGLDPYVHVPPQQTMPAEAGFSQ